MRIEFLEGPRKGEVVNLDLDTVVIGRDRACDVTVEDDEISRRHAELTASEGQIRIRDLGSQNGTRVGRSRVKDGQAVSASDRVQIGDTVFTAEAEGAGATRIAGSGGGTRSGTRVGGGTRLASGVPAMLEVVSGPDMGRTIEVPGSGLTIGRESPSDVQLDDDEVSREHIKVRTREDGSLEVTDLGSRNGTTVDGSRISAATTVNNNSEIAIGHTRLKASTTARAAQRAPSKQGGGAAVTPGRLIAAAVAGLAVLVIALLVTGVIGGGDDEDSTEALTTPEIVEQVGPSTVQVTGRQAGQSYPLGTGWVLDNEEGLIVTNAHVVEATPTDSEGFPIPVTSMEIVVDGIPRRADVHAVAPCEDLALLRVGGLTDLPNLELGSQSDLVAGERAIAMGYAGNFASRQQLPLQANEGTVSVPQERAEDFEGDPDYAVYENVVQMDTPINHGNSGGPLVNERGELIGVNTLGGPGQNQNYAIGVDRVKEITDQMRDGDSIGWSGFGFLGSGTGLLVTKVFPNSASGRDGFPSSFQITPPFFYPNLAQIRAINNRPVSTRNDYCNAVAELGAGESAVVRWGFAGQALRAARGKTRITFE